MLLNTNIALLLRICTNTSSFNPYMRPVNFSDPNKLPQKDPELRMPH